MASLIAFDIFFVVLGVVGASILEYAQNTCAMPLIITKTATVCGKMTEDMSAARKHLVSATISLLFSERDLTRGDDQPVK